MSHPTAESCPEHGDYFVVPLDPEDEEERPISQEMTHRCAACGRQLGVEHVPAATSSTPHHETRMTMRDDPQLDSPPLLATLKRMCEHLLATKWSGGQAVVLDDCRVDVQPTLKGPVINGVPDPNVAWSAYASVYDVRVDLYGCGPTPRPAVECLLRDVERNIARLAQGNSAACKTCKGAGGWTSGASDPGTPCRDSGRGGGPE